MTYYSLLLLFLINFSPSPPPSPPLFLISPLVAAAETNQTAIYQRLIDIGCDPTRHLSEACSRCMENAVKKLLENGADPKKKFERTTPFLYILESKKSDDKYSGIEEVKKRSEEEFGQVRARIISLLLEKGVNPKESPNDDWKDYFQWVQKNGTVEDGKLMDPEFKLEEKLTTIHPLQAPMLEGIEKISFGVGVGNKKDLTRFLPEDVKKKAAEVEFKAVQDRFFANCIYQPIPGDGEGFTIGYDFEVTKKCPGFSKSSVKLFINAFTVGKTCYAKEIWCTFHPGKDDVTVVNPRVDHIDIVTKPIIQYSASKCKKKCEQTQRFCVLICYEATEPWGARKRVKEALLKKIDATCMLDLGDPGDAAPELKILPQWVMPKLQFK